MNRNYVFDNNYIRWLKSNNAYNHWIRGTWAHPSRNTDSINTVYQDLSRRFEDVQRAFIRQQAKINTDLDILPVKNSSEELEPSPELDAFLRNFKIK